MAKATRDIEAVRERIEAVRERGNIVDRMILLEAIVSDLLEGAARSDDAALPRTRALLAPQREAH